MDLGRRAREHRSLLDRGGRGLPHRRRALRLPPSSRQVHLQLGGVDDRSGRGVLAPGRPARGPRGRVDRSRRPRVRRPRQRLHGPSPRHRTRARATRCGAPLGSRRGAGPDAARCRARGARARCPSGRRRRREDREPARTLRALRRAELGRRADRRGREVSVLHGAAGHRGSARRGARDLPQARARGAAATAHDAEPVERLGAAARERRRRRAADDRLRSLRRAQPARREHHRRVVYDVPRARRPLEASHARRSGERGGGRGSRARPPCDAGGRPAVQGLSYRRAHHSVLLRQHHRAREPGSLRVRALHGRRLRSSRALGRLRARRARPDVVGGARDRALRLDVRLSRASPAAPRGRAVAPARRRARTTARRHTRTGRGPLLVGEAMVE